MHLKELPVLSLFPHLFVELFLSILLFHFFRRSILYFFLVINVLNYSFDCLKIRFQKSVEEAVEWTKRILFLGFAPVLLSGLVHLVHPVHLVHLDHLDHLVHLFHLHFF